MRRPRVRDDHQCVYPEVSRTHTFGDLGTHFGAFFEDHLQSMLLNEERIDWKKQVSSCKMHSIAAAVCRCI
jgi:hypothetical protein